MSKVFLWLFLLPPIEIFLWIWVAHFVSGWWILLWTIGAFFFGMSLMVKSFRAIPQLRSAQGIRSFQLNSATQQLAPALIQALAGLLFVIPGLLTDAFALFLLLPPVQHVVQKSAMRKLAKSQEAMQKSMMEQMRQHGFPDGAFTQDGFAQQGGFSGTTVEGEARTVEPMQTNSPQIGRQPANDD
ncbi:MAG TPA: FxsA family protein [Aquirhabdus sp.]